MLFTFKDGVVSPSETQMGIVLLGREYWQHASLDIDHRTDETAFLQVEKTFTKAIFLAFGK